MDRPRCRACRWLPIVNALLGQAGTRVLVSGGQVFPEQNIILSAAGDEGMPRFHAPKLFIGAAAVGPAGLMQPDVILVAAERRLIERAKQIVVLVDSSKFNGPSGHVVCPLDEIDVLVTDSGVSSAHNVNFKLNDDHLLYAFIARGAKPGGFNSSTSEFEPEAVWDYEAGWKATLADGHVRTQLGVFYNRYSDFQFDIRDLTTGQDGTSNLPDATIRGAEAQLQTAFGGFNFDAGVAYVDSKLSSLTFVNTRQLPVGIGPLGPQCAAGVSSNPPTCFDYTPYMQTTQDGPNLFSPEWTYNAGVEYAIPVGEHTLTPRVNYAYVGPVFTRLFYSPVTDRLEGRGLLSAFFTFEARAWSLQAYGTNLTDKEYVTGQTNEGNQFFGAPREYGLRIRREF